MRTADYLSALKAHYGISSDYALAKALGISFQSISRYKNGGTFDNLMALRVADLLQLPPLEVITDMEIERARRDELRDYWHKQHARFARVAAAVCVPVVLGSLAMLGAGVAGPELAGNVREFIRSQIGRRRDAATSVGQ